MEIIKWDPLNDIEQLFNDRLLLGMRKLGTDFAVDLYEEDKTIIAKMILSDISPDNIHVSVDEDTITISGRREEEKKAKHKDYYSKEIRRGTILRTVSLPKTVDASKAIAEYRNGVLTVKMPVVGDSKKKSVKINIAK